MSVKDVKLSYWLELAAAIVAGIAVYLVSSKYDVIEAFVQFSREHENWELDETLTVFVVLVIFAVVFGVKHRRDLISLNRDVTRKNEELQVVMREIKQLKGIIPICANCKKIRDDKGYWHQVEVYIGEHTAAEFSHGLCPDCVKKLHPGIAERYHNLTG
ncbi:MAG: hypothetical protein WC740_16050 [Verrucomicrobiia bacterium]